MILVLQHDGVLHKASLAIAVEGVPRERGEPHTLGRAHAAACRRSCDLVGARLVDLTELELKLVHEARRARMPVTVLVRLPIQLDGAPFLVLIAHKFGNRVNDVCGSATDIAVATTNGLRRSNLGC